MEIVYYPDLYISDEIIMKSLALFWGDVKTIVPPTQKAFISEYLNGNTGNLAHLPLETYKKVNDILKENTFDFLTIKNNEREMASQAMFNVLTTWNKDSKFYDSLKINSIEDLIGKNLEFFWILHEKLEQPLVELMMDEHIVVNWSPDEMMCYPEVGKAYMSILTNIIKNKRGLRIITNDEFSVASKAGINLIKASESENYNEGYQIVSLSIPEVFIRPGVLKNLTWQDIGEIRRDLLPLREAYYTELETYQNQITNLYNSNKDTEAFDKFCEFCERVAISFQPFAIETNKILRKLKSEKAIGYLSGIILPTIKLLDPNQGLNKVCDIASIAATAANYIVTNNKMNLGFEYLENVNRKIRVKSLKNTVTRLISKSVKEIISS